MSSYITVQSSPVHGGSKSLRFEGKAKGPYAQQSVAASGGQTVRFSGWVNVPVRNQGMDGGIELQAYGSSGGAVGPTTRVYSFESTTGGWVYVTGSHQVPAGASSVKLKVRFTSLDGTVSIDDLSLVR
jgi:hypothetical protein